MVQLKVQSSMCPFFSSGHRYSKVSTNNPEASRPNYCCRILACIVVQGLAVVMYPDNVQLWCIVGLCTFIVFMATLIRRNAVVHNADLEETHRGIKSWFDNEYTTNESYLRQWWSYDVFLRMMGINKDEPKKAILDLGCGTGLLAKNASMRKLKTTGLDISDVAVQKAKEFVPDGNFHQGVAEELPFEDNTFDFVTAIGVIERFLDREKALGELRRVMKPGAKFTCLLRNSEALEWLYRTKILRTQETTGHQDAKNLDEWSLFLEKNGFMIDVVYPDQYYMQRFWRWFCLHRICGRFNPTRLPRCITQWSNALVFTGHIREDKSASVGRQAKAP